MTLQIFYTYTDTEFRACLKCTTQKSSPNSPSCSISPSARCSASTMIQMPSHRRANRPSPTPHKRDHSHHQDRPQNQEPRLPGLQEQGQQRYLQGAQLRRGRQQEVQTHHRGYSRPHSHLSRTRRDCHRDLWPRLGLPGRILHLEQPGGR